MTGILRGSGVVSALVARFVRQQLLHASLFMVLAMVVAIRLDPVPARGACDLIVCCAGLLAFYLAYGTLQGAIRDRTLEDLLLLPGSVPAVLGSMMAAAIVTTGLAALLPSIWIAGSREELFIPYQVVLVLRASAAACFGVMMALPAPGGWKRGAWFQVVRLFVFFFACYLTFDEKVALPGAALTWAIGSLLLTGSWAWWVAGGVHALLDPGGVTARATPRSRVRPAPPFVSPILWYGVRRHARGALWMGVLVTLITFPTTSAPDSILVAFIPGAVLMIGLAARASIEARRSGLHEELAMTPLGPVWVSLAEIGSLAVTGALMMITSAMVSLLTYTGVHHSWWLQQRRVEEVVLVPMVLFCQMMMAVASGHSMGKRFAHTGIACLLGIFLWLGLASMVMGQVMLFGVVTMDFLKIRSGPWFLIFLVPAVAATFCWFAAAVKPAPVTRPT